jgi:hypothetical protein
VALPLLADEPRVDRRDQHDVIASVRPEARALAVRNWIACLGFGEEPARFACALSSALGAQQRYALLSQDAPPTLARALQQSGAEPLHCPQPVQEPEPIQQLLRALPERALILVVDSIFASQLCGVLDVWIGRPPSIELGVGLTPLHAAADLRVPAQADDVASALGRALERCFAAR